ncbi:hypothetical protein ACTWPT_38865 [Nonomuraea sp. 3N208]|uniref:hypothetical protein n=1 Tax=Nonomuraea sp. 3N208 TaxID=3457421 RepID=UPI003FD620D5
MAANELVCGHRRLGPDLPVGPAGNGDLILLLGVFRSYRVSVMRKTLSMSE